MSDPKRRLLVIDDDPGIRTQMKWALCDYEVITAKNRSQALEQFNKYKPAIVTLDLGLPPDEDGTDEGYAILSAILAKSPETRVVVVSGSEAISNAVRAVESGAFEFYPKPVNITLLQQVIERAYQAYKKQSNLSSKLHNS